MKCPNCATNHLRGKQGMTCKCGYKFVFDPKSHGLTDGKFLAHVRRASRNGTYFFTENQLYATACRSLDRRAEALAAAIFFGVATIGAFTVALKMIDKTRWILLLPLGIVFIGWRAVMSCIRPRLKRRLWNKHLDRWQKRNGSGLEMLIYPPHLTSPPPDWNEPDIYDYGVEQILICERDAIVDWLVLNRYHVTTKTAVIGESGYPEYILPKVNQLLASGDPPSVYLLHDAAQKSQGMAERVRAAGVFKLGSTKLIDLGLSPDILPKIRSLKNVRRSMNSQDVPVDTIPLATLAAMTTCAFSDHCSFDEFASSGDGSSGFEFESSISDDGDGE